MRQTEAVDRRGEPTPDFAADPRIAQEIVPLDPESVAVDGGDEAEIFGSSPPEHGWPGTALVWMMYAGGALSLGYATFLTIDAVGELSLEFLLRVIPFTMFPGLVLLWIARMVQQFKLAGWGVAMLLMLMSFLGGLNIALDAIDVLTIGLGALGMGSAILWIGYLWTRRGDFT